MSRRKTFVQDFFVFSMKFDRLLIRLLSGNGHRGDYGSDLNHFRS